MKLQYAYIISMLSSMACCAMQQGDGQPKQKQLVQNVREIIVSKQAQSVLPSYQSMNVETYALEKSNDPAVFKKRKQDYAHKVLVLIDQRKYDEIQSIVVEQPGFRDELLRRLDRRLSGDKTYNSCSRLPRDPLLSAIERIFQDRSLNFTHLENFFMDRSLSLNIAMIKKTEEANPELKAKIAALINMKKNGQKIGLAQGIDSKPRKNTFFTSGIKTIVIIPFLCVMKLAFNTWWWGSK